MDLEDDAILDKSDLKRRGWTERAINEFLSEPDPYIPTIRGREPIHLYSASRIKNIEQSEGFRAWYLKEGAQLDVDDALWWAENVEIEIPNVDINQIKGKAIKSYNMRRRKGAKKIKSRRPVKPEFMQRILVNYIRHKLVNYEELLRENSLRQNGSYEAYQVIARRVLTAIAETWPSLELECKRKLLEVEQDRYVSYSEVAPE